MSLRVLVKQVLVGNPIHVAKSDVRGQPFNPYQGEEVFIQSHLPDRTLLVNGNPLSVIRLERIVFC